MVMLVVENREGNAYHTPLYGVYRWGYNERFCAKHTANVYTVQPSYELWQTCKALTDTAPSARCAVVDCFGSLVFIN